MFFGAYNSLLIHASMSEKTLENPVFMLPLCIHYRSCSRRQVRACRFVDHLVYTYTHIHARTHIHAHTHTHTHERTHTYAHTYTHAHTHTNTQMYKFYWCEYPEDAYFTSVCVWERERACMCACVCVHDCACTCMCVRTCVWMRSYVYACASTCMQAHALSLARKHGCARTHTQTLSLSPDFFVQHTHVHTDLFSLKFSPPFSHSLFLTPFFFLAFLSLASLSLTILSLARSLARSLSSPHPLTSFFTPVSLSAQS